MSNAHSKHNRNYGLPWTLDFVILVLVFILFYFIWKSGIGSELCWQSKINMVTSCNTQLASCKMLCQVSVNTIPYESSCADRLVTFFRCLINHVSHIKRPPPLIQLYNLYSMYFNSLEHSQTLSFSSIYNLTMNRKVILVILFS